MVPDKTAVINTISIYKTLSAMFERMIELTLEKKDAIQLSDWGRLTSIVENQNSIKDSLEKEEKRLSQYNASEIREEKVIYLKNRVKELIQKYKDSEAINIRMLKDSLYLAKLKANKIFNIPFDDDTYSPVSKKSEVLGGGVPVMFDRLI